jgi:hypothetical protein
MNVWISEYKWSTWLIFFDQVDALIPPLFFYLLFFWKFWGLNSGPTSWATPRALFCDGFFRDRVSQTFCTGWLRTLILLISAFQVARIYRHEPLAPISDHTFKFLRPAPSAQDPVDISLTWSHHAWIPRARVFWSVLGVVLGPSLPHSKMQERHRFKTAQSQGHKLNSCRGRISLSALWLTKGMRC